MVYPAYDLIRMKLKNEEQNRPAIYEHYEHPWYKFNKDEAENSELLNKPNPPTKEAVKKSKFIDKTYVWRNDNRIRH